jgi:hypothetical protein
MSIHVCVSIICLNRILLSTLFYPLYPFILGRILDNRARPCLVCCDLLTLELLQPPLPAVPITRNAPAQPMTEPGSLFALLFRTASYPPLFIAPVRTMIPVPLQRMLHSVPLQHLPAFFRTRAVQGAATGNVVQGDNRSIPVNTPNGPIGGGVEYLELSLSDYYFLSCAAFLLQPDIHVQPALAPNVTGNAPRVGDPPTPDAYNLAFLRLMSQYLDFFAPAKGTHSTSLALEENGWNVSQLIQQGWSMIEVWVEVLMGQFSYEAAQQLPATTAPTNAFTTPSIGLTPLHTQQFTSPPLDEFTLPTVKVINAIMRIVYHLLEQGPLESPTGLALQSATATRASILAYQQEKYTKHAESQLVKLRVDWHLFGVLQHCFTRWASEWSSGVGVAPVMLVSASAASSNSATGGLTSFSSVPARVEDRLTKLIELWLDYLEPWKSIYNEEFNPYVWRWWIVANLPFYTTLLRDFLRLVCRLDIGREQSPARTAHLKTLVHLLKIFDGAVLAHVDDIESALIRAAGQNPAQTHFMQQNTNRGDKELNQQTQNEICKLTI